MRRNPIKPFFSTFLSCEKDSELIIKKLFFDHRKESEILRRLLVINTKDCIDNFDSKVYQEKLKEVTPNFLFEKGYIRLTPKLKLHEHEEVKTYIILTFDDFITNKTNPQFRDCTVSFDIVCNSDYWDVGDYRLRPLQIAGYIDGILNNSRLTGIGKFLFLSCNELILDENLSGYTLMYSAIHGSDDEIPFSEEENDD